MGDGGFLSTASVETILAGVGALVVLSAVILGRFDRSERRSVVAFFCCLVAIWAVAVLVIYLLGRAL